MRVELTSPHTGPLRLAPRPPTRGAIGLGGLRPVRDLMSRWASARPASRGRCRLGSRGPRGPRERRSSVVKPATASGGEHAGSMRGACGEHAGSMRGACGEHAGAGSVALLPRLPAGCGPVECCGCCLGGGRLGGAKAAPAAAHPSFVRTARPFESCANKSSTHQNLVRNVRYESGFGGLRSPVRNAENSNSTYRYGIRIWFRRPSTARSKCRKFEFNVSAR
jgi:hypothetical protein